MTADGPPLLLVHGEFDTKVTYDQSERIYQAYQKAGLEAELITIINGGHAFNQATDNPISPTRDETEQIMLDFFIRHLLLNR